MARARDFEKDNARMWEAESQVTDDDDDTATIKAPSDDGSEGVQLILDASSTSDNTKILKATTAFQSLGVHDSKKDPFLNVLRESQKQGDQGGRQYGPTAQRDQQEEENISPPRKVLTGGNPQARSSFSNSSSSDNNFRNQSQNRPQLKPPILTAKARGIWAEPVGLITTRMAAQGSINVKKEQVKDKYTKGQIENVDILVHGHYLWPDRVQSPHDFFGLKLEDLDPIKHEHRVYIDWDESMKCLVAKSDRTVHAEINVMKALEYIRRYYKSAKARKLSAEPYYIVTPPTASGMRSMLIPHTYRDGFTMIGLIGDKLSIKKKLDWKTKREEMIEENDMLFQYNLSKRVLALEPYREWMRMRVHFGHFNLPLYPKDFLQGGSFQRYKEVLKMPRAQAVAQFDKKLPDPKAAVFLIDKILSWHEIFCPRGGREDSLEEVTFRDSVCLFLRNSQDIPIRVEADIDRIETEDLTSITSTRTEYQMGATRHFWDNQRNKHLELITVDIEKKIDWTLELITDNTIVNPDPRLNSLVQGCVTNETKTRKDSLNASYPNASPRAPYDINIDLVVLRSTIQYQLVESGSIVEVTIYRTWEGRSTAGHPKIEASVSMFHQDWEWQLDGTETVRDWDQHLTPLFSNPTPTRTGIQSFLEEVAQIQGYLSDCCKPFYEDLTKNPKPANSF